MAKTKRSEEPFVPELHINEKYIPFLNDTSRVVSIWGGKGSGKSWVAAQKIVLRMLTEKPHRFLGVYKTHSEIKTKVWQQIIDVIEYEGLSDLFSWTEVPPTLTCKKNGNEMIFKGLDQSKIGSIAGITGVWIEEINPYITWKDWQFLDTSIRGEFNNYFQIILTWNPIDIKHWSYQKMVLQKTLPVSSYFTTYLDNKKRGADYENVLETYKDDEAFYRMAKYGEPMALSETAVFKKWYVYDDDYIKQHGKLSKDINDWDKVTAGLDFGAVHNSACLVVAHTDDKLIVLDEVYLNGVTNYEFIQQIKKKNFGNNFIYYADNAEPARIREFKQNGFNVVAVKKGKGSVGYALDYLRRFKIIVMPHCKNTLKELSLYSYKYDDKSDTIHWIPEENQQDDAVAALRYSVNPYLPRKDSQLKAVSRL